MTRVAFGEAAEVASNIGPGFELLALGLSGIAHRVEARPAAEPSTTLAHGPDEPEALHAARAAFDDVRELAGGDGHWALSLDARRSVRRGHGGVTPAAAAGALAALSTLPADADVSLGALVGIVARAEQRAFGLPRAACAIASLCGGLGVTTELHPPRALRWRVAEWFVAVVEPDVALRPHALKAALPNQVALMKAQRHAARSHGLVAALHDGDADAARAAFGDAIVEPALARLFTGVHPALNGARQAGAIGAWMTGSGPNLCALCETQADAEAAGEAMAAAFAAHCTEASARVTPVARLRDPVGHR